MEVHESSKKERPNYLGCKRRPWSQHLPGGHRKDIFAVHIQLYVGNCTLRALTNGADLYVVLQRASARV
jgi:hypothetical protein